MSLLQSINDLRGAPTMVEGQRRLNRVYLDLVGAKKPKLAAEVNRVRNDFNSYLCETETGEGDSAGYIESIFSDTGSRTGCYRQDQAIPGKLKAKLRRLSERLSEESPTAGEDLDPDSDGGVKDELQTELPGLPIFTKVLIAAGVLFAVWNLTK